MGLAKEIEERAEACGDLPRREHGRSCRGEFERERQAVETPADLDDGFEILRRYRESRIGRAHPVGEEGDGAVRHRLVGGGDVSRRHRQRRDSIDAFARNAQRLAARDQQRNAGAFAQHRADDAAGLGDNVLAVVYDEQRTFLRKV